jgi:hypothetical protein
MVPSEVSKSFIPLGYPTELFEVYVQFGHSKDVGFCLLHGCADLLVFVTIGIEW